ncbi:MAG: hypothetical protein U0470_12770 [Anaerolineae bacterium]
MVGVNAAKGLAMAAGKPIVAVNHLAGHLASHWLHTAGRLHVRDAFTEARRCSRAAAAAAPGPHRLGRPRTCSGSVIWATSTCWPRRATAPPARRSTRRRGSWASATRVARRSSGRPRAATRRAFRCRWRARTTWTGASAG